MLENLTDLHVLVKLITEKYGKYEFTIFLKKETFNQITINNENIIKVLYDKKRTKILPTNDSKLSKYLENNDKIIIIFDKYINLESLSDFNITEAKQNLKGLINE